MLQQAVINHSHTANPAAIAQHLDAAGSQRHGSCCVLRRLLLLLPQGCLAPLLAGDRPALRLLQLARIFLHDKEAAARQDV